ncbi:MAG: nuclear transport factor 2 family protein [Salinirussus sp.]
MVEDDRQQLRDLKHQYCYIVDEAGPEEWARLFTEDAVFTSARGETYTGRDEILAYKRQDSPADEWVTSAHMAMNPLINLDGDTASGQWYYLWYYENAAGDRGWGQGRYDEAYRRTADGWRFSEMTITHRINPGFGYD